MAKIEYKGQLYPVTNMFDIDGDETDNIELACSCVVKISDDEWLAIVVNEGDLISG